MADYPLIFRIIHVVRSANFEAIVVADGRALMAFEDGAWWCHGVDPGALTEGGPAPVVAFEKFRSAFRHVLDDLAEESGSFEEFQRDAKTFFGTDAIEEARWDQALERLPKRGTVEEPFRGMSRMVPRPSAMVVTMLASYANVPMPSANEAESVALALAA